MGKSKIFIDTSGYFSILSSTDKFHKKSLGILEKSILAKNNFITSDHVLSETATLLMARGFGYISEKLFDIVLNSEVTKMEFISKERFERTRAFFIKNLDQGYSFCDCTSFILMKELSIKDAFTSDEHFTKAGFNRLLQ
jgi:predicted nucleic acid-binding protein